MKKALLCVLFFSLGPSKETFYIQTIKIEKKILQESRKYYGNLVEIDSLTKIINARTDGFVEKLFVANQYSPIKKGEKLFDLYSPELFQVQSEYINSLRFKSNIRETREKLVLLGVEDNTLETIQKNKKPLASIPFYSPYDGIVFEKNIIEGQFIKRGDPLYKVVDIRVLWFVAKVPQSDYEFLSQVKDAKIQLDGFLHPISAKFLELLPKINPESKFVEARFIVKNPDLKLYPNMFGISFLQKEQSTLLFAPKESILMRNGVHYAFVQSEDGFEPVEVEVRRLESGDYEILSGLEEGSEIAKNALFILDADAQNNGGY